MEEQRHGRYYAQELSAEKGARLREQIQDVLDEGDKREWHLVGVSDISEEGVILFWDTARPSFGRTTG